MTDEIVTDAAPIDPDKRLGSDEEIAAVDAEIAAAKAAGTSKRSMLTLYMKKGRLCRKSAPPYAKRHQKLRLQRAIVAEERVHKARVAAETVMSGLDPEQVKELRALVMGSSKLYVETLLADMVIKHGGLRGLNAKEAHHLREKAKDRYHELVKLFAGKQMDREPKKVERNEGHILVREWPSESVKG